MDKIKLSPSFWKNVDLLSKNPKPHLINKIMNDDRVSVDHRKMTMQIINLLKVIRECNTKEPDNFSRMLYWPTTTSNVFPFFISSESKSKVMKAIPSWMNDYIICPYEGGQRQALNYNIPVYGYDNKVIDVRNHCDIVLISGSTGGGKTFIGQVRNLQYLPIKAFNATTVRKAQIDILSVGGAFDNAKDVYQPYVNTGEAIITDGLVRFIGDVSGKSNATSKHTYEYISTKNHNRWQGRELTLVVWEELGQWDHDYSSFDYLLTRNRFADKDEDLGKSNLSESIKGKLCHISATFNANPNSWLSKFLKQGLFVCPVTNYILDDNLNKVKWFIRTNDESWEFHNTEKAVHRAHPKKKTNGKFEKLPLSVVVIEVHPEENKRISKGDSYERRMSNIAPQKKAELNDNFWGHIKSDKALWRQECIDRYRINPHQSGFSRDKDIGEVIVIVDPAATTKGTAKKGRTPDSAGITAVGVSKTMNALGDYDYYILEDATSVGKDHELYLRDAMVLATKWKASNVYFESNMGGSTYIELARKINPAIALIPHWASGSKEDRAMPVAALYTNGIVHHVGQSLDALELEQTSWIPHTGMASPGRIDSLVHGISILFEKYSTRGWLSAQDLDFEMMNSFGNDTQSTTSSQNVDMSIIEGLMDLSLFDSDSDVEYIPSLSPIVEEFDAAPTRVRCGHVPDRPVSPYAKKPRKKVKPDRITVCPHCKTKVNMMNKHARKSHFNNCTEKK